MTDDDLRPLFVGGCERSGTTLLATLLAAHPNVVAVPEAQFVVDLLRRPPEAGTGAVAEAVGDHWRFLLWDLHLDTAATDGLRREETVAGVTALLARRYAAEFTDRTPATLRRWVDHTPWNLRHAALLATEFPDARFVHLVRDGRAVAASVLPLPWGPNDALAAAHWWLENVALALVAEERLGPDRVLRVRYEDLVAEPDATVAKVLAFAGVDLAAGATGTGGFMVPAYTRDQHRRLADAPNAERIDAWRQALTARDVERFESVAETLLAHLGYRCEHGERAQPAPAAEQVARAARHLVRFYALNPPRNRARRVIVRVRAWGRARW